MTIVNVLFLKLNTTAKILKSVLVLCFISFSRPPLEFRCIVFSHGITTTFLPILQSSPWHPFWFLLSFQESRCSLRLGWSWWSGLVVLLASSLGFDPLRRPRHDLHRENLFLQHTHTPSASAQLPFRYRSGLLTISPSVGIFLFLSFHPQWSDTHQRNVTDLPSVLLTIQGNLRKSLSNHQVEVDGSRHMGRRSRLEGCSGTWQVQLKQSAPFTQRSERFLLVYSFCILNNLLWLVQTSAACYSAQLVLFWSFSILYSKLVELFLKECVLDLTFSLNNNQIKTF